MNNTVSSYHKVNTTNISDFPLILQPRSASATCSSAASVGEGTQANWWEVTMSPEPRTSRSPRQRSNNNSAQNSPNRTETSDLSAENHVHIPGKGQSALSSCAYPLVLPKDRLK